MKSWPQIRVSAPTYAEAEERLIEAIQDAGGAMQVVMEFDPPLPKSSLEEKYSKPEIYLIGGDDRFETDTTSMEVARKPSRHRRAATVARFLLRETSVPQMQVHFRPP